MERIKTDLTAVKAENKSLQEQYQQLTAGGGSAVEGSPRANGATP